MFKPPPEKGISAGIDLALDRAGLEYAADWTTRLLFSTDASIYQILPLGVIWPRDASEVSAVVEIAREHQVPVLPRGSGSSLAGQAIGEALILDFSRYLDRITYFSPEERVVEVQPGLVLGGLNRRLESSQLIFGPDPASADRATIGGVLGNNAAGAHSILYGMAHDHLLEADVVLSDGSSTRLQARDQAGLAAVQRKSGLAGALHRDIPGILERYQTAIQEGFPKTFRNVAGYNLKTLLNQTELNLAALLAGSEGTLGIITSARLNLVPLPAVTTLYLIHFNSLYDSLACVPEILETNPSAIELIDRTLLELARANPSYRPLLDAVQGHPEAILAVEYQGEQLGEISDRAPQLEHLGQVAALLDPPAQARIWKARKVGLGILQSQRGDHKLTTIIEDAAVPVEHLADYTLGIRDYAAEIGVGGIAFYAHASAGLLHIRPQINLKSSRGLRQLRQLAEKSLALVLEYGGTTAGEHGEGISRGEFTRQLYGEELYSAFAEVKNAFDPEARLNPGKIINPPALDSQELLRYGPGYQADLQPTQTLQDFSDDQGFDRAVEMCNGAGVCRQLGEGLMCPSFQATRDEKHSTRGRSNLLRAAITGQLDLRGLGSRELYQALDLCLSCQGCLSECPSSVDMSKLKAEALNQYYQEHRLPIRSRFFAHIEEVSRMAQPLAAVVNPLLSSPLKAGLSLLGIHPGRAMPAFASQRFTSWYKKNSPAETPSAPARAVFFYDTYLEYNYPWIGQALVEICKNAGLELVIPENKLDSGRPAYSKGLLQKARRQARKNLNILAPFVEAGLPLIGCEPSVMVMLRKEYPDLVPGPEAEAVSRAAILAEEFLLEELDAGRVQFSFDSQPRRILYHGHCQQKANFGTAAALRLLSLIPGAEVEEIDAGCCGMAGAFGYEKEHYQISLDVAEDRLAPRIRQADQDVIICASGTSCREQILHTTGRKALHPLEIFAASLV